MTATIQTGSVVTVRPYQGIQRLTARRGICLGEWGDHWLIWFPGLDTVQPIHARELTASVAVTELPTSTLRGYLRKIYRHARAGKRDFERVGRAVEATLRRRVRS